MSSALDQHVGLQAFPLRDDISSVAADLARRLDAAHAVVALDPQRFGTSGVGSPGVPRAIVEGLTAPAPAPQDAIVVRDFASSAIHAPLAAQLAEMGVVATVRLPLRGPVGVIGTAELLYKAEPAIDEIAQLKRALIGEHAAMNVVTVRLFSLVERAKREWEVTFDAIRDGIMVLDRDCRIRRANWGMGIMLGSTPSLLVGKTCHEAVFSRPAPCANCPLVPHGAARPFKAHECEDVIDERAVQVAMYPLIGEDGSLSGLVSIVRDISERKKEEREFRLMHEELVRAHATLQGSVEQLKAAQTQLVQSEKMAAVGQLISGVAHELNNPLTGIIGYTQLLQDVNDVSSLPTEKLQKYVRYMGREAARCQKIVQNLLTFARRNEPEKRHADLNDIVRRTFELKAYDLRVNDIAVELQLADSLPATMADAHQLQQVLLNLLVNAQQAIRGGRGKGSIVVRTRLSQKEGGGPRTMILEVQDDGPGFSEEVKARLFDPFFTTKEVGQGTGLGLSICYGIVQEHEGSITAHHAPGGGALFRIELPVVETREKKKPTRDAIVPARPAEPGRRVLVIDDEATICDMVRDILQLDGHLVDTARNGEAGLQAILKTKYDCVLVDLKMPEVDGMTLHAMLVERDREAASRMIFMTGDMLSDSSREFLERAGNPYLAKPFSIQDLRARIASVLAESR